MNSLSNSRVRSGRTLAVATAVAFVLAACSSTPRSPEGAAEVRSKLTRLQSDPNLGTRAPLALQEAESAVRVAEQPVAKDAALGAHRVYMADRKVEIAVAQASTRFAEDQRAEFADERDRARLAARTQEADKARADADATSAAAAAAASAAAQQADALQRQIEALQAKATDRGLVLTLGDVLFTSGRADLKAGATSNLDRLVTFLNQNPGRNVVIEGHTDSVGADDYNQALSQRRADSVKSFLVQQGVSGARLSASGMGEHRPVAENESASGRQQNRRVEIIIGNPTDAVASN